MKSVVLCEKPSVARDIARNLGAKNNKNGCLEGDKYVVTWALGHLITLQTPDKYKEFNNVNLENLPMIPKFMKTEIIKKTFKQYKVVENALNRKDVNEVIIATDAGREGELVARYIIDKAKCNKNVKRLWISSVTDKAIKDGFRNLKDGKEYLGLYHSGIARANADWLVGINASRALTLKYNASLNCGRVQTPTLQMVFEREEKIKQFKPKDYYTFEAQIDGVKFSCGNSEFNLEKAEQFIKKNINKEIKFNEVQKKAKTSSAKPLYNLTDIQQTASALFGMSPKQTLNIVQSLYERHKVLTYPRTDSRYLTSDMKNTLKDRIQAIGGDFRETTAKLLKVKDYNTKKIINNAKVSDHHAIIPTISSLQKDLSKLPESEAKVYRLITNKLHASVGYPLVENTTKIVAEFDGFEFSSSGKVIIDEGFTKYLKEYKTKKTEDTLLPGVKVGEVFEIRNKEVKEKYTSPPKHFTEDTLLKAMEVAGNDALEKGIEVERKGLGTPATRAGIIENLIFKGFIERDKKNLIATNKGISLVTIVSDTLKSAETTAEWEMKLSDIANGKANKDDFLKCIENEIRETVGIYRK